MMDRPRSADRCTKAPYTSCANARPARPRRIPRMSDVLSAASCPYLNILICLPRDPPADIRGRMRSRTAISIRIPRLAPLRDATYAAGSRVQVLPFLVRIALGAYPVSFAWTISILQEINPSGSVFWPDVSFDDAHSRGESGSSRVLPAKFVKLPPRLLKLAKHRLRETFAGFQFLHAGLQCLDFLFAPFVPHRGLIQSLLQRVPFGLGLLGAGPPIRHILPGFVHAPLLRPPVI